MHPNRYPIILRKCKFGSDNSLVQALLLRWLIFRPSPEFKCLIKRDAARPLYQALWKFLLRGTHVYKVFGAMGKLCFP